MVICGATLDEAIAGHVLADRERVLPPILDDVRTRLAVVRDWMAGQDAFEWIEPRGGVVGLVRFRPDVEVDTARFHEVLLAEHGTYVGPGHWFELDDRSLPARLRLADRLGVALRVSPRCRRRPTGSGLPLEEVEGTEVDAVGTQVVLEVVPEQ